MEGAIFHFSPKIGLKSTKNMQFCILHKPMGGGARAPPPPPPPGYATACMARYVNRFSTHIQTAYQRTVLVPSQKARTVLFGKN